MTHTLFIERYQKINEQWVLEGTYKNEDYNLKKWKEYILDSRDWFERLGGTERTNGKTLTSISPDGNAKTVYTLKKVKINN